MGTPAFAVPSLEVLVDHKFDVVAVVTAPDKPQGRGQKLTQSPVKEYALKHNIPVLQPANLKATEFQEKLKHYGANLQVVVAFRMLPEAVWSMPGLGTFNLHASLLPQYRGAAPINWAIINGEKETGVTTFFLQHEIDTGGILFQETEPILDTDNAGTLYDRLKIKGANLVLRTVEAIASGSYEARPQPLTGEMKRAPKIFKETCSIIWDRPAANVCNFIRGLSPYPSAWTQWNGKLFKVLKASIPSFTQHGVAGQLATDNKTYLYVKTSDQWVSIDELQPEGKKKMGINEFFRGNKL